MTNNEKKSDVLDIKSLKKIDLLAIIAAYGIREGELISTIDVMKQTIDKGRKEYRNLQRRVNASDKDKTDAAKYRELKKLIK